MKEKKYFKKLMLLIGTVMTISVISIGTSYGQLELPFLQAILNKITEIETLLNSKLSQIVVASETLARIWTAPDTSQLFLNLKSNFETLGSRIISNTAMQRSTLRRLNLDMIGKPVDNRNRLNYANDILYSGFLGEFYYDPDPRNQNSKAPAQDVLYNYIRNASGISMPHVIPGITWRGTKEAQDKYQGYFNLIQAVSSYNGYILSNQYADRNQFNDLQKTLIDEANSKDWYDELSTEVNMSVLLRRILMFQSQMFVLLTQLIQTQKQLVTAQAMTNSLLIASQQQTESFLLSNAQGIRPTSPY